MRRKCDSHQQGDDWIQSICIGYSQLLPLALLWQLGTNTVPSPKCCFQWSRVRGAPAALRPPLPPRPPPRPPRPLPTPCPNPSAPSPFREPTSSSPSRRIALPSAPSPATPSVSSPAALAPNKKVEFRVNDVVGEPVEMLSRSLSTPCSGTVLSDNAPSGTASGWCCSWPLRFRTFLSTLSTEERTCGSARVGGESTGDERSVG